jgi:transposase-like protein
MWPEILESARAFSTDGCGRTRKLRRLRREITHLKLENDILKKAAVILGTKTQLGDVR